MRPLSKLWPSQNERELRRMDKTARDINSLEQRFQKMQEAELRDQTRCFRERLASGENLENLLVEAFATAREAARRVLNMRHFDVQLLGGLTLHKGGIAEMGTGEGKTLVATLPIYLNALSGEGVHLVTVNDYLAKRDAEWMGPLYEFLDVSVGVILSQQSHAVRRAAYQADITYGTNNEFGFDYLRDNMVFSLEERVQRELKYAIVDEVDSILIDEARTPLIISGAMDNSSRLYQIINQLPPRMTRCEKEEENQGDYVVDEKHRQTELTENGHQLVENWLRKQKLLKREESLYSPSNLSLLHHVHAALRAYVLFRRDVEYIVSEGSVILIDEHTGRTMPGRRLSEGLHQALEAKEKVPIQSESQTLASTTFQNYFRVYPKLAGMTGTAATEAKEFQQIYNLTVVNIPPNKSLKRADLNDVVFLTKQEKYEAVIKDITQALEKDAPVLVGTASIETSEEMSELMKKHKIHHRVLNAKHHEREAEIIAEAGRPGHVTIATNMAGRGTDIVLGGNPDIELEALKEDASEKQIMAIRDAWEERHQCVIAAGGLHIFGTERHESRRIDNQLRGRAGRQGDPGVTRFYLSLEDDLMRIFASDRVRGMMQSLGMEHGEAIEHRMVTNAIERAQRKVEARNFDQRKQLLEYDGVANEQRQVIYKQRNELLLAENSDETARIICADVIAEIFAYWVPSGSISEQWDLDGLQEALIRDFNLKLELKEWLDEDMAHDEKALLDYVQSEFSKVYEGRAEQFGDHMNKLAGYLLLQILDTFWKEHLARMDYLRQGIHLRAYAQRNPRQEYKRESFEMFGEMLNNIKREFARAICRVELQRQTEIEEAEKRASEARQKLALEHETAQAFKDGHAPQSLAAPEEAAQPSVKRKPARTTQKIGRNQPCPCGSGKKYKQCCGANTSAHFS